MAIDVETVRRVAKLARLELTAGEETALAGQLGQILGYVEQLSAVDTSGLEPTQHSLSMDNVVRVDEPHPSLQPGELLAGAPATEQGMFRVPKIL